MTIPELVHLYFDRSTALQNYWTLYVVIIGGLLAFSSLRQRPSFWTTLLVAVLYCCFAYKNMGAILDTIKQREATLTALKAANDRDSSVSWVLPTLEGMPSLDSTKRFHVTCDVLTVVTLFAFEIRRRRYRNEDLSVQSIGIVKS